jgi:hypothetical protein
VTEYITLLDYVVLPFVLAFIYGIAYKYRNKHYPVNHPWRKYFLPGLTVKVFGAVFITFVYVYYYGGGDTIEYYVQSKIINSSFNESFDKWIKLILRIPGRLDAEYYTYTSQLIWYDDPGSYAVCSITAFLSFFTLGTYLPAAVLFAAISFTGVWALFRTFAALYKHLTGPIAIATLFIPSTFIWGSGIFKDTICLFGLGWLTYSVFRILIKYDFRPSNLLLGALSVLLVAKIKIYILLAFLPAVLLWILFLYTNKIKNTGSRIFLRLVSVIVLAGGAMIAMQSLGEEALGRYSLDNLEATAATTRNWISYSSGDEGSGYSLGEFDGSFTGMLSKFPLAVNVTLFRPYLWEANKVIVFLSAMEAFLFLFLTIKLLFSVGLVKIYKTIINEPTIQFCLIFALIFAFAVGITTYNFGSLSRYKIPCLPFYLLFIILTYYKMKIKGEKLFKALRL